MSIECSIASEDDIRGCLLSIRFAMSAFPVGYSDSMRFSIGADESGLLNSKEDVNS